MENDGRSARMKGHRKRSDSDHGAPDLCCIPGIYDTLKSTSIVIMPSTISTPLEASADCPLVMFNECLLTSE